MNSHLNPTATKILHLLNTSCKSKSHLHQILAQIIHQNLHRNTTISQPLITACKSLNLLTTTAFPFYINPNPKPPHTYTFNSLLQAFSHSKTPQKCILIYSHMHRNGVVMNNFTVPFVLKALTGLKLVKHGFSVHCHVIKLGFTNDVYVGNSLLNLYGGVGEIGLCVNVFDEMPVRDVVSWTTLISGFNECERFDDGLITFERMRDEGVVINRVTVVSVLNACAGFGALDMGVWVHEHVVRRNGWDLDVVLGTSLIDMYGSCGRIEEGLRVFEEMREKNVFTWNTIIKGLGVSKSGKEAVKWFLRMEEEEGIEPDEVTLVSVLSACVHSGFVHMGRRIFSSLVDGKYGFKPNVFHYGCMVDLLVRSRCLDEAVDMINEMPFEPTVSVWGALLAGCRAQGNLELGEFAALKLVELEPGNCAYYVVLSNLYAEMGRWSDVEKVRELMKERGMKKDMGSSAVELEHVECAREFVA